MFSKQQLCSLEPHKNLCHLLTQQLITLTAIILIFVNYLTTTQIDPVYVQSYLFKKWSFIQ
jgi:hypothetical protein